MMLAHVLGEELKAVENGKPLVEHDQIATTPCLQIGYGQPGVDGL